MSIVPVSHISAAEMRRLGNNLLPQVRRDASELEAVNRTLQLYDERVDRLYARARPRTSTRRCRRAA